MNSISEHDYLKHLNSNMTENDHCNDLTFRYNVTGEILPDSILNLKRKNIRLYMIPHRYTGFDKDTLLLLISKNR